MLRFAMLFLLLTACTVDESVAPPEPPPAEATPEPTPEPPAQPETPPEPLQLSPDVTPVQDLSSAIQQLGRLMTFMRQKIQEAGERTEGDDCTKARAVFLASNQALRDFIADDPLAGGRTPPYWEVLPERQFAQKCHQLPEEVQRCLRLDVRTQDRPGCTPLMTALPEDQKNLVNEIAQSVQAPQPGE
ncbi:MAG: hypothetical protein JJ863_37005 [Deltaproteobacteria bacterium]|nr:hypothetical protein [Deltaproteobacteria bacterium]